MTKKTLISLVILCWAVSTTQAQHILRIFINNIDVTESDRWAIHPHDFIRLELAANGNSNYEFDKVTFELLVKDNANPDRERPDRTKVWPNMNSQSERIRHVKESDIFNLLRVTNIRNSQFTRMFTINCDLFKAIPHFSRLIIHIKKVKIVSQNQRQTVHLDALGDYNKFFSDGISFWSGQGFI